MKNINLSKIMKRAWELKKENENNIFSLCLKQAWKENKGGNNMRIETWFDGNTFPKKEELKALGAVWNNDGKIWEMQGIPETNIEGVKRHMKIYITSESEIKKAVEIATSEYKIQKSPFKISTFVAARITPDITKVSKEDASKIRKAIRAEASKIK